MEDIRTEEMTKKLKELDEADLRLVDSGISLLAARHKVEEEKKSAAKPVLMPAT